MKSHNIQPHDLHDLKNKNENWKNHNFHYKEEREQTTSKELKIKLHTIPLKPNMMRACVCTNIMERLSILDVKTNNKISLEKQKKL